MMYAHQRGRGRPEERPRRPERRREGARCRAALKKHNVYIYAYIHICVYSREAVYIYICIMHVYIYIYIYIYICIHSREAAWHRRGAARAVKLNQGRGLRRDPGKIESGVAASSYCIKLLSMSYRLI